MSTHGRAAEVNAGRLGVISAQDFEVSRWPVDWGKLWLSGISNHMSRDEEIKHTHTVWRVTAEKIQYIIPNIMCPYCCVSNGKIHHTKLTIVMKSKIKLTEWSHLFQRKLRKKRNLFLLCCVWFETEGFLSDLDDVQSQADCISISLLGCGQSQH